MNGSKVRGPLFANKWKKIFCQDLFLSQVALYMVSQKYRLSHKEKKIPYNNMKSSSYKFHVNLCNFSNSVFIRDCSNSSFAIICQQFRTRDCKRITTFLSCATQPIIESSVNMKFGCITAAYDSLSSHLTAANISPFVNNWNNVHDFTPVPGESNFSILKKNSRMEEYIHLPEETVRNQLKVSFTQLDSVIPCTLGTAFRPDQEVY